MFFTYPDYDQRVMWMKDMKFPLDIIWIRDNRVTGLTENLPMPSLEDPNGQVANASSGLSVNKALEVNAGFIKENNINIGDEFQLLTK